MDGSSDKTGWKISREKFCVIPTLLCCCPRQQLIACSFGVGVWVGVAG